MISEKIIRIITIAYDVLNWIIVSISLFTFFGVSFIVLLAALSGEPVDGHMNPGDQIILILYITLVVLFPLCLIRFYRHYLKHNDFSAWQLKLVLVMNTILYFILFVMLGKYVLGVLYLASIFLMLIVNC